MRLLRLPHRQNWPALICVLCLFTSPLGFAMSEDERQARLKELRTSIKQLQIEIDRVKGNRGELLQNLEKSESKIGELSKKVEELKQSLENEQSQLKNLRSEKEALTSVKKQQQGSVKQHINAAYRLGLQSDLKLLLNQGEPSSISRNLKYYDYLLNARAKKIQEYVSTIHKLEKIEPAIVDSVAKITTKKNRLEKQRESVTAQYSNRKITLAKIEKLISDKDSKLEVLVTDRRRLENLFQKVVEVLGELEIPVETQPFPNLKGKIPWPTKGKVVKRYGSQRIANKMTWKGMLIKAKEGSSVSAIHHGRVVFSDYLRGHGLLIIIDHGSGYMSLYAHNQTLYKELGDWVSAGEQIASVGISGGRNTAGLYFELRHNGTPTNPQNWLKRA